MLSVPQCVLMLRATTKTALLVGSSAAVTLRHPNHLEHVLSCTATTTLLTSATSFESLDTHPRYTRTIRPGNVTDKTHDDIPHAFTNPNVVANSAASRCDTVTVTVHQEVTSCGLPAKKIRLLPPVKG